MRQEPKRVTCRGILKAIGCAELDLYKSRGVFRFAYYVPPGTSRGPSFYHSTDIPGDRLNDSFESDWVAIGKAFVAECEKRYQEKKESTSWA
jgi:hypothetical protein